MSAETEACAAWMHRGSVYLHVPEQLAWAWFLWTGCFEGVVAVIGGVVAHWRAYWLGESQPSAVGMLFIVALGPGAERVRSRSSNIVLQEFITHAAVRTRPAKAGLGGYECLSVSCSLAYAPHGCGDESSPLSARTHLHTLLQLKRPAVDHIRRLSPLNAHSQVLAREPNKIRDRHSRRASLPAQPN